MTAEKLSLDVIAVSDLAKLIAHHNRWRAFATVASIMLACGLSPSINVEVTATLAAVVVGHALADAWRLRRGRRLSEFICDLSLVDSNDVVESYRRLAAVFYTTSAQTAMGLTIAGLDAMAAHTATSGELTDGSALVFIAISIIGAALVLILALTEDRWPR